MSLESEAKDTERGPKPYWSVESLNLGSQELVKVQLKPLSFLILMSDGYIGGSRDAFAAIKILRERLTERGPELSAQEIKGWIIAEPRLNNPAIADDRTLVILQWRPDAIAHVGPTVNACSNAHTEAKGA